MVKVLILKAAGINCEEETAFAFKKTGAIPLIVHINRLINKEIALDKFKILVVPGGFSYGDSVSAGRLLANEIKFNLREELLTFVKSGRIVIGICNGFQGLVEMGLLPKNRDSDHFSDEFPKDAALIKNNSEHYEDRWVYLKLQKNNCVFLKKLEKEIIYLPVAHGEGRFITRDIEVLKKIKKNKQIVFKYVDSNGKEAGYPWNPNGAIENIAAICNSEGNVFGMMPHPERHITKYQHPRWTREKLVLEGDGMLIFKNAVSYAKHNL